MQAQTTLVNFTVTEKGLEDQLLAEVVSKERPDLQQQMMDLVEQQNEFTIKLKELEDNLLMMLANAEGDILGDEDLILSLEETKATSQEIAAKVVVAKDTEATIAKAREIYRPIAERGALMFFLVNQLHVISHMYQFSLDTFNYMFVKAISKTKKADQLDERCRLLLATVTYTIFAYVTRGLFEKDRLIFSSQLGFRILGRRGELPFDELDFIIKAPKMMDAPERSEALQWLPEGCWGAIHSLADKLPEAFAEAWAMYERRSELLERADADSTTRAPDGEADGEADEMGALDVEALGARLRRRMRHSMHLMMQEANPESYYSTVRHLEPT